MRCLVIMVNRLQLSMLGHYGNDWLPTPHWDKLASESVVFDQHFSECPLPGQARWSWHTGSIKRRKTKAASLARRFWEANIPTIWIADERSPSLPHRFSHGWEQQRWVRLHQVEESGNDSLLEATVQAAIEEIEHLSQQDNWLMWLELSSLQPIWQENECHVDYFAELADEDLSPWFREFPTTQEHTIGEKDRQEIQTTYGCMVSKLDQLLGAFCTYMLDIGLYDDMMLVITSDRGFPLGEHGIYGDEVNLHEELVHLPLLIHLPGGEESGRRVQQLTQLVDLYPTLCDAFGISTEEDYSPTLAQGRSLIPVMQGEPKKLREFACSYVKTGGAKEWSIRTHQWYLILSEQPGTNDESARRLYIKPEDRWEANNVIELHRDVAEHLELALRRYITALRSRRVYELPPLRDDILRIVES